MTTARLFISQEALSELLDAGSCDLEAEELRLAGEPDGRFALVTAVRFLAVEVGVDEAGLLDRVLDVEALEARGAEHVGESVLLGETAYRVQEGFLAAPASLRTVEAFEAARRWASRHLADQKELS